MRVVVCGSRDWTDEFPVNIMLNGLLSQGAVTVVHGGARGADRLGRAWAERRFLRHLSFPADWKNRPRWLAGPERNQRMLDEGKPDLVLAFKDDFNWKLDKGGTEDMVRRAKEAGILVYVVSRPT